MKRITNKRYKIFVEKLGYNESQVFNNITKFNVLYMKFTSDMAQLYRDKKNLEQIYDFVDFDNFCIEYLKNNEINYE